MSLAVWFCSRSDTLGHRGPNLKKSRPFTQTADCHEDCLDWLVGCRFQREVLMVGSPPWSQVNHIDHEFPELEMVGFRAYWIAMIPK